MSDELRPKPNRVLRKGDLPDDAISQLMNMDETVKYFYPEEKDRTTRENQLRLMALMCTIDRPMIVAQKFGVGPEIVRRAWRKYRHEMADARITRNKIVAGLAERRAIETLQGLNIKNVPDDRKGRLVKDLMDSADIANKNVKPPVERPEESTMELIFRIKNRASQNVPKPSDSDDDDVIDADFEETQKQIPQEVNTK